MKVINNKMYLKYQKYKYFFLGRLAPVGVFIIGSLLMMELILSALYTAGLFNP